MDQHQKEQLIAQIKAAFKEVPYPGDDNLVLMGKAAIGEQASIAARLKGKHWSQIPQEDILWHNASFSMMTPEALRYYLPAFLIACIVDLEGADVTFNTLIWALSPPPHGSGSLETFNKRVAVLDAEQRQAVRLFFDYVRDELPHYFLNEEPWNTLTDYWSTAEAGNPSPLC